MDLNIKTDWNQEDYYNAEDLNRVEHNTLIIADMIKNIVGISIDLEGNISRNYKSLEFANDLNRIENNIELLNVLNNIEWTKMKTSWMAGENFSYEDAIRLEINLQALFEVLNNNSNSVIYCGEIYSDEGGI